MKYIRTKDGRIYEVKKEQKFYFNCVDKFRIMQGIDIHKDIVLQQADDIEELFDEFVFHDMEINMFTMYPTPLPLQKHAKLNVDYEQFGAIWTKWGLKHVAKMKGILQDGKIDWELL